MQTGTAGLQNISDIDSIESRCEKGVLGIESKFLKNASGDQEESFLIEFIALHTPPNNEKGQPDGSINTDLFVVKNPDMGIIKNTKLLESVDSHSGKLDKIQIDETKTNEYFRQNADIITKATGFRFESSVELNEKFNVKSGEPYQLSASVLARKSDLDIGGQPRAFELAGGKMDSLKKELGHLQDKLSPHSENDAHARFTNSSFTKTPTIVTSLDPWQKYMNIMSGGEKPPFSEGNINVSKVIDLLTNDGEETNLTSNNQTAEKYLESVGQTKEPSYFQRQFQPDVMRQLAEKTIFGVKNGQSLIKISLKPEHLGHLRMQISTANNQVAVRIITEVPMVKEIIESNINQLRADLQNHGLEIEKFNVYVDHDTMQNDRNPSHILFQNGGGRTDEENVKNGLSEEGERPVQSEKKGRNSTLIDFFA